MSRPRFRRPGWVALAECGTHAVFAARIGRCNESEATLTRSLLDEVTPGMLLLADRGFFSYALWRQAIGTGAGLLWRVGTDQRGPKPIHVRDLDDGSWLAHLAGPTHCATARKEDPMLVRVIDYTVDDGRENATGYRLFTTMLDPGEVSAGEVSAVDLAATYAQRWEIELVFDELKTHQRGPRTVLRSKSPDLVRQEIWGHLCCHFAIRSLMVEAADTPGTTQTESASSPRYGSPARPSPNWALSPPDQHSDPDARHSPGWLGFLRRLLRRRVGNFGECPRRADAFAVDPHSHLGQA